jgi:DNA-binding transcriptional MerR regulator
MAHTVKQVAEMSGVSVRTLHFYDETGLLKPARHGANGYRFYEEPQLLILQQILFYRELGFELKQIKGILGRADFEKVAALQSHRKVLKEKLARTRTLMETIDKTIEHLRGTKEMQSKEMFLGFSVAPGKDRFGEHIKLGGERMIVKCLHRTQTAQCVFSSSPAEAPVRATFTTTRMSGSTSSMASLSLTLLIGRFAWLPVNLFSSRARLLMCGSA